MNRKILTLVIIFAGIAIAVTSAIYSSRARAEENPTNSLPEPQRNEVEIAIENALYTKTEFFGADAIVPFPTSEARDRLASLLEKYPNESIIFLKISELDERLNRYEDAERELKVYVELNRSNQNSLEKLALYFHRRAQFEKEAATLQQILKAATGDDRAAIFARLIELARKHELKNYLKPDFYREIIAQDPESLTVVTEYIDKLIAEKSYPAALAAVRQYRGSYSAKDELLEKEIEILLAMKKSQQAEAVYHSAFDPFWSQEQTEKYYDFLSEQDRYRLYGRELRENFKRDQVNLELAIRLFHFEDYDGDSSPDIFARLEKARAEKAIVWQPEELITVARFLIAANDVEAGSRFLYTLLRQNNLPAKSELRAKILYGLFKILSDAGEQRIALTRGDLEFYRDVATADSHPGIATGILSLIFADANPKQRLAEKELAANKLFNRDAAYRIFLIYKNENSLSPELGQMYLDIVRLYAAAGETEIAAKTLLEFERRPEFVQKANSLNYAKIALKLAGAYSVVKKYERERAVYQSILDHVGKQETAAGRRLVEVSSDAAETMRTKPAADDDEDETASSASASKTDLLVGKSVEVSYSEVLNRFVASLARENKTTEILALYADEARKYPTEAGLEEQLLEWLGQTNLVEEQLKTYRRALAKFPNATWQDRLARWFLRQKRQQDFEKFSLELIEKLDDAEASRYLAEFVDGSVAAKPDSFNARLYLALYTRAHNRFPHNLAFVQGLLKFYQAHNQDSEWRQLTAQYYFESPIIREQFLSKLAQTGELRGLQKQASAKINEPEIGDVRIADAKLRQLPYKLFRADAAARLSNYEEAVDAYRELNSLYPNTFEYAERLINLTRSLGQINRRFLIEAAQAARAQADAEPSVTAYRIRAGETQAELGDYVQAGAEWQKLLETNRGEQEIYLETATIFWDYFQYDAALQTIQNLRRKTNDNSLYAFEAGAILEAKRDQSGSLAEYVKALDGSTSEAPNVVSSDRAKRRLEQLSKRPEVAAQIQKAFEIEQNRRADDSALVLGYADFLRRSGRWKAAATILKSEIARSKTEDFLVETRDLSELAKDAEIKTLTIKRLAETAQNRRFVIKYSFQLAENLSGNSKVDQAAAILRELVQKFPNNYGVLNEASNFYWRINRRADSVNVLQTAAERARGKYQKVFGRKLAARFLQQNDDQSAEQVLQKLYAQNALDAGVYDELTNIYVRTGNRPALAQIFKQTLGEIKEQEIDFREINRSVAELRTKMIGAFTRLKDYRAGVEQHIEIINRDPDDKEVIEAAINYVRRYGAANVLADYYKKVAAESYKNYRWFVVLARIYEANGDLPQATENYRLAINNQPEIPELYDALAAVYERQKNYGEAIKALNKTLELTNDDPIRLKRIIAVYEKAGRTTEAIAARSKLPIAGEKLSKQSAGDQFAEAARLKDTQNAQAVEKAQKAFDVLVQNPFANELKTADLVAYVNIVRTKEPLDLIAQKLWKFREQLITESEKADSTNAGRARTARQTVDGALVESVGNIAAKSATGPERAQLFADLSARTKQALATNDDDGTLALVQNLSRQAGFEMIEEQILIAKKDASFATRNEADFHQHLNYLLKFYRERAAYKTILELLETERQRDFDLKKFDYPRQIADVSKLLGNLDKELAALREHFAEPCEKCLETAPDALVARYFEMLWKSGDGKKELDDLSQAPPARFQIQLINFLIGKNEKELAHRAIENSKFSSLWKQARQAQTSLALKEFGNESENYFRAALRFKSIGELTAEKRDAQTQLVGDDWFRLTQNYGEWLYQKQSSSAPKFLAATIENRPSDHGAQSNLGSWYLEQKNFPSAIEHFALSLELEPNNKFVIANLGAAYHLAGNGRQAEKYWAQIISGENLNFEDFELYVKTLQKYGRAGEAREKLAPIVTKKFNDFANRNASNLDEDEEEKLGTFKREVRLLAETFDNYEKDARVAAAQAAFFLELSARVKENVLLPEFIVSSKTIAEKQLPPFYQLLIERSPVESASDYKFTQLLKNTFDRKTVEDLLDQQENYRLEEPASQRIKWQKELLDQFILTGQTSAARRVITQIETETAGSFARPVWLRLADWQLQIRAGNGRQTLPELKRFVGISVSPDAPRIIRPSLERLNEIIKLLESENKAAEADELRTAFYARLLALEQFEWTTFAESVKLQFKLGNAVLGLKLLELMTALTDNERKEFAAAEISNLELVKSLAADATKLEDVTAQNSLNGIETLKIAAEIAAQFQYFERAIEYRQKLRGLAPADENNRLELARLFAEKQNGAEALKIIAEIIADRLSLRKSRWQAALVAAEICANRVELWSELKALLPDLQIRDSEMWIALTALELEKTNRVAEATEFLKDRRESTELKFLNALLWRQNGKNEMALSDFLAALKANKNIELAETFGFVTSDPLRQTIELYALGGQPFAALQLAGTDARLKSSAAIEFNNNYQTLSERHAVRDLETRRSLLKTLSNAAEQTENFKLAAEFENIRLSLLSDKGEQQTIKTRIEFLLGRQATQVLPANFTVNQNNFSEGAR